MNDELVFLVAFSLSVLVLVWGGNYAYYHRSDPTFVVGDCLILRDTDFWQNAVITKINKVGDFSYWVTDYSTISINFLPEERSLPFAHEYLFTKTDCSGIAK